MKLIDMEKTGRLLRNYREYHQLTYEQLAQKLGMAPSGIRRWEKGMTSPGAYALVNLADIYGRSIDDLIVTIDGPDPVPLSELRGRRRK